MPLCPLALAPATAPLRIAIPVPSHYNGHSIQAILLYVLWFQP